MDFSQLLEVISNILIFLIVLTAIISIHEFGHFIFAKKAGVYVYEFSLGFGPKPILSPKEYISVIPSLCISCKIAFVRSSKA